MSVSRRRFFSSLAGATVAPIAALAKPVPDAAAGKTQFQRLYECWDAGAAAGDRHDLRLTVEAVAHGNAKAEFIINGDNSAFLLDELSDDARSRFTHRPPGGNP